jgi:CHASE2 domain-containing sensor protein
MTPPPASRCTAPYALSSQLALRYLEAEGISPEFTKERNLKLGDTVFKRLKTRTGGYQHLDAAGHQVLLNYRSHRSPQNFAGQVTVTEVLQSQLNPDMVRNRVVLIGITAPSVKDYFFTPYSEGKTYYQQMPGVVAHAQMVSQMLSAVLDGRPLLWVWPWWGEMLWIWGWSLLGGLLFWRSPLFVRLGAVAIALLILSLLCFVLLIQGGWIPLIPSALALVFTGGSVVAYAEFKTQR